MRLQRGVSMIETLIALPILLIVGLGALQFALILQARHALNFALIEAARAGSVEHADPTAIRTGMARGLLPWLYGAQEPSEYLQNLMRTEVHFLEGELQGWVMLSQQSPTPESFDDWSEPARNANGELLEGVREIPHDNLGSRSIRMQPASGVAGLRGQEPIGQVSGQTLNDANLLRLRLDYGVPLVVPVVGRLMAWTLRVWDGCEALQTASSNRSNSSNPPTQTLGAVRLPIQGQATIGRLWPCAFYGQNTSSGSFAGSSSAAPRIPLRVVATVRMQSPARQAPGFAPSMLPQTLSRYALGRPSQSEPTTGAFHVDAASTETALPGVTEVSPDQLETAMPTAAYTASPATNGPSTSNGLLSVNPITTGAFTAVPAVDPAVCVIESRG